MIIKSLSNNEHFFFGPETRSLFGSYHAPSVDNGAMHGILLCYPFGFEYLRAHRALRQLAIRLGKKGFSVLRFDFYGTGDSVGDLENVNCDLWQEDIQLAVDELKRISGLKKICVIGLRLGASIALMASAKLPEIDSLVLWEPIVRGEEYLIEIAHEAKNFGNSQEYDRSGKDIRVMDNYPNEIIGFPMPPALFSDLRRLDLMTIPHRNDNVHLVSNEEYPDLLAFYNKLKTNSENVDMNVIDEPKLWLEEPYKALVPVRTLERIIKIIAEKVG